MKKLRFILLYLLCFISWIPSSLDLTLSRYFNPDWLSGILFLFPFIFSFLFGLWNGKTIFLWVGLINITASFSTIPFHIWDLNHGVAGGFEGYGSWPGIILFALMAGFIGSFLSYLGGSVKVRKKGNTV